MIVEEYLATDCTFSHLSEKYGVSSGTDIKNWVLAYQKKGEEALKHQKKNRKYSFDYKLYVVNLYLTGKFSYRELAIKEGFNNPTQICNWVNSYKKHGPDSLLPQKESWGKSMSPDEKKKKTKPNQATSSNQPFTQEDKNQLKALQDENLKLRIENAYLKELRRMRLEEEMLLKKRRELYTSSEKNSD